MGAIQAYVNYNTGLSFSQDLNAQIECCGTTYLSAFGNIQLWKIKNDTSLELFSFTRHVYYQDSTLLKIHSKRTSLQHPNILKYYACTQDSPLLGGNVETLQFFFEYIPKTLSQNICARSETFREIEVWKSLEQLVSVLKYLQENECSHGKITSDNIFITSDQTLKTLDQITIQQNSQQIKQDVFDLAQVIVELMTKKKFHVSLKETVISLMGDYSQQLLQLLARMLNNTPEKRPDFIELSQILQSRKHRSTSVEQEVIVSPQRIKQKEKQNNQSQNQLGNKKIIKVFNQNVYQRHQSPQKIIRYSPQRIIPYQTSPQRVRVISPQRKEPSYLSVNQSFQQLNGIYRTASPIKQGNINGSQASTIGSYGASLIESYKTQYTFYTQRNIKPNIYIPQHKSEVKRMLFKEDLNQTSSSQPPIEIIL
ncbi:unnamed protein product [Paramecium sonneborni]|uniref:Protein kinase domain-containing protein n=1 Tax=Paramecium sonneborni TaxID=65129 RepID=A0A8S1N3N2_9CILI|nr:unnamed protein product [Paramecium sonneborni]